jgi:hypothetical protein
MFGISGDRNGNTAKSRITNITYFLITNEEIKMMMMVVVVALFLSLEKKYKDTLKKIGN